MEQLKKKILVADDEPEVLRIMVKKIASSGYEVISAETGAKALALIRSADPDCVVLDINMPELDGFAVLAEMRANPVSAKWQPVIIVSAREELEDIKKGYSLEADHYITKPCQVEEIIKGIRLMLNLAVQRKTGAEA